MKDVFRGLGSKILVGIVLGLIFISALDKPPKPNPAAQLATNNWPRGLAMPAGFSQQTSNQFLDRDVHAHSAITNTPFAHIHGVQSGYPAPY